MIKYQKMLRDILNYGVDLEGRNAPVRVLHGYQVKYDLTEGFPLLTTKKMSFESIKAELLAFIRGADHVSEFQELGTSIWNANAESFDQDGFLGPIYGTQWRMWYDNNSDLHVDQLANCIKSIQENPYSRRHLVSAWNVSDLDLMCLPPCHVLYQFHVYPGYSGGPPEHLSLSMYQRSCDAFLGVPYNIASYSLLLHLVAKMTYLKPLYFIHNMGDLHLYHEHFDVAGIQLQRRPGPLPIVQIRERRDKIEEYEIDDIELIDYKCDGRLKARMIV